MAARDVHRKVRSIGISALGGTRASIRTSANIEKAAS